MSDSRDDSSGLTRRRFIGGMVAAGALSALVGCSGGEGSGSDAASGSSSDGGKILSFYLSEPAFIDPYNVKEMQGVMVDKALFDPLLAWDWDSNTAVPLAAAEAPTVSDDGLTYTFKLREGMTFHNGEAVDAAAFKRGWERIADPSMASPSEIGYHLSPVAGYAERAAGEADEIAGVTCPDELTFQVTLTAPMADFPAVCCHPGLSPVPQAALDDPDSFLEMPIGNGPFKLDEPWQHNQYISASRFDDYYGDAPALDGVYFSIQADPDTAFTAFKAGSIDFSQISTGQIKTTIDEYGQSEDGYTATPGAQVLTGTEISTYFLDCNMEDPVLADVDVRHAISCAINRDNIVDTLFEGTREPANSIFPRAIDDSEDDIWDYCTYDPDRANELLDKNYPRDSSGSRGISLSLSYNGGGGHEDVMSSIQADLEAVGITVTQDSAEWATYLENLSSKSYQLGRAGWNADYPTMDNFIYPNFYSTADNNSTGYNNPEVDAAIEAARQITDDEERKQAYRDICKTVGQDMPLIPIMFFAHNYVASDAVQEFFFDAQAIPHFETAKMA